MQQFDLSVWLQDKSRKVVTRIGEEVKIVDTNATDKNNPIVGYIYHKQKWNGPWSWYIDGIYKVGGDNMDLFFADEEVELTEFERAIAVYIMPQLAKYTEEQIIQIKSVAKTIMELAMKESQEQKSA